MKEANLVFDKTTATDLELKIGHVYKNKEYLHKAFVHSSYANAHNIDSNEKLEFLGDSILNFVVAEYFYKNNLGASEGELSTARAKMVSKDALCGIIGKLELNKYLLAQSENKVQSSDSVKSDMFEAIVASIYLDDSLYKAKKFIYNSLNLGEVKMEEMELKDFKTRLQEYYQSLKGRYKIVYQTLKSEGKPHNILFTIELKINSKVMAVASAHNKSTAEQQVAKLALIKLGIEKE
ncbi:MAG: ribonuclease III [Clostridia bacterium]|nr:ribonuclease III [Clostridia bacterium]